MSADGQTRHVAEFILDTNMKDIPPAAVRGAKLLILDTIGVGLAALGQPVARSVIDYVRWLEGKPVATVLGTGGFKTTPVNAALANACFFNMLDYDGFHHVPTHVLAATLATGEMVGATGEQALEAFIVASEFAHRFNQVFDGPHTAHAGPTRRGWYHLSIYGPIASALAASKLLGLDLDQTRAAMGNAVCGSGGVRQVLGSQAKSLAPGHSASFGVQAALLAQRGMLGDADILEARLGLVNALCLPGEADWAPVMSKLGKTYALGVSQSLKRYPSVSPTHIVIVALERLMREHAFRADDVVALQARVITFSAGTAYAMDELSAGFSWPYILGAVLLDGSFKAEHLLEERVHDPRIRQASSVISFQPLETGQPQLLTVTLKDGRTVAAEITGGQARMETEDEVLAKYRDCAGGHLPADRVERVYEQVMSLEKLGAISELMQTLSG